MYILYCVKGLPVFLCQDYCSRQGGYLVHIETPAENTFLRSFCETLKGTILFNPFPHNDTF